MAKKKATKKAAPAAEAPAHKEAPAEDTPLDEDEGELGAPHHQSRASMLEEIARDNREAEEEDEEPSDDDLEAAAAAANEAASEEEPQDQAETDEPAPDQDEGEAPDDGPPKKKYIVDGVERYFTDEEITAIVQKSAAADARLAEATRLLKDAKATPKVETPSYQPPSSPSSEEDAGSIDERVTKLTKAIVYGEEEQVSQAVRDLLSAGRNVGSDIATQTAGMGPEQVRAYVQETIAFEDGKKLLEDPPERGGYADIWSDPMLKKAFQSRENELRDLGDDRSYVELYKSIGDELRDWRDSMVKQFTPKNGLEDRQGQKAQTGVVSGVSARAPVQKETRPLTDKEKHEQVLDQQRKSRGIT